MQFKSSDISIFNIRTTIITIIKIASKQMSIIIYFHDIISIILMLKLSATIKKSKTYSNYSISLYENGCISPGSDTGLPQSLRIHSSL